MTGELSVPFSGCCAHFCNLFKRNQSCHALYETRLGCVQCQTPASMFLWKYVKSPLFLAYHLWLTKKYIFACLQFGVCVMFFLNGKQLLAFSMSSQNLMHYVHLYKILLSSVVVDCMLYLPGVWGKWMYSLSEITGTRVVCLFVLSQTGTVSQKGGHALMLAYLCFNN